jgi:type II restriction enzyme
MGEQNWTNWTDAVWACIEFMGIGVGDVFKLRDIYNAEDILNKIYPDNNNVKEKIRQQLQIIRDHGRIEFVNDLGVYQRLN